MSSSRQGGHQLGEPDEIEDPPEIVGECGQAEFGANLLQATHQKRALVHPLLDRAKWVFDRLATPVEDTGALREPRQHELAEHRAEGLAVIVAEISDGLEVGLPRLVISAEGLTVEGADFSRRSAKWTSIGPVTYSVRQRALTAPVTGPDVHRNFAIMRQVRIALRFDNPEMIAEQLNTWRMRAMTYTR
jgi:hypothetical protein